MADGENELLAGVKGNKINERKHRADNNIEEEGRIGKEGRKRRTGERQVRGRDSSQRSSVNSYGRKTIGELAVRERRKER